MCIRDRCNRNVGGSSRYLVSCFQQYFWENIFKFLIYERRWSLLCFPIFKFSINQLFVSNLQGFGNPICNLGDLYWVDLDLSYSDTHKYLPLLLWFLEGWFQNESIGCYSTMFLWKIKFSLQQKEGSNDQVGPKYYVSSVGVPCCHCRMDKSFFKKALRFHTKSFFRTNPQWEILLQKRMVESNQTKQEKNFMPDYGRLECVALTNHLYSHSSRSVPSISYM